MSEQDNGNKSFFDRLQNVFRINVLEDETLREVRSFRVSLKHIYLFFMGLCLLSFLLGIALMSFTPLKRSISGFGDIQGHPEYIKMNGKIRDLEKEINAQNDYIEGFKRMLNNDLQPDEIQKPVTTDNSSPSASANEKASNPQPKPSREEKIAFDHYILTTPLKGTISAAYEAEIDHFGIDILAPANSPIKAVSDGVVIQSGWNVETGNTISIQHKENLISVFKHNSVLLKKEGDFVQAGEVVAIIGNSGTLSDGPHLHFELWYDGRSVNPQDYINFE